MLCNVTSPVPVFPSSQTAVTLPAYKSAAPAVPPWTLTSQLPVMCSKAPRYAGLPDWPDRAGMRQRRKQTEMTVGELQRQRGVAPAEKAVPPTAGNYGYRQLSELIGSLPAKGMQGLLGLMDRLTVDIGPLGCAAAPLNSPVPTLDAFRDQFSRDFEIWASPAAGRSGDMKGMIVVLGEDHVDPVIQDLIGQVMRSFSPDRGDRFFMEGGDDEICREREQKYAMALNDCQALEKNSPGYSHLSKEADKLLAMLKSCVDYIYAHVPVARAESCGTHVMEHIEFIRHHAKNLPPAAAPSYRPLVRAVNEEMRRQAVITQQQRAERDAHMAAVVRAGRLPSALNYVIVGANHLRGMGAHLRDLPCVFMVPKQVVEELASHGLPSEFRPEL